MIRMIIDRFEGNIAVVEVDNEIKEFPRCELPEDCKEGDVIIVTEEGKIVIDKQATNSLRNKSKEIMGRLWED